MKKGKSKGDQSGDEGGNASGAEKEFRSATGELLDTLPDAEWKRVTDVCNYHNTTGCKLSPAECWEKDKRKHENLPKKLLSFLREPGNGKHKPGGASDTEASATEGEKEALKVR